MTNLTTICELGVTAIRGRVVETMYVGETSCESARMELYASGGSHIEHFIRAARGERCTLLYRAIACRSKSEAKRRQDELLDTFEYPGTPSARRIFLKTNDAVSRQKVPGDKPVPAVAWLLKALRSLTRS